MGIKGLNKFLRDTCPDIFEEINIKDYAFKKVAIDISLYMCKYKAVCGDRWPQSFINLVACLRKNDIHCIFIYDGKAPVEKIGEQKERRDARDKTSDTVEALEVALAEYHATGEIAYLLYDFYEAYQKKTNTAMMPSLRKKRNGNEQVREIDIPTIESLVAKRRQQLFRISPEDFALTRELFDILKVPHCIAPAEAETMCADLCKRGLVHAVLSDDSDVIAYGAPLCLMKLDIGTGRCCRLIHADLIATLELNEHEFLDFCIMCGTDYNKNIPRIGPAKAFALIEEYRNIESIAVNTAHEVEILHHERTRELFTTYEEVEIKIPFCGRPDMTELEVFLFKNNIRMSVDSLKASFLNDNVVFD